MQHNVIPFFSTEDRWGQRGHRERGSGNKMSVLWSNNTIEFVEFSRLELKKEV